MPARSTAQKNTSKPGRDKRTEIKYFPDCGNNYNFKLPAVLSFKSTEKAIYEKKKSSQWITKVNIPVDYCKKYLQLKLFGVSAYLHVYMIKKAQSVSTTITTADVKLLASLASASATISERYTSLVDV